MISLETTARQCGDHAKDLSSDLLFLASHGLPAAMLGQQNTWVRAARLAGLV